LPPDIQGTLHPGRSDTGTSQKAGQLWLPDAWWSNRALHSAAGSPSGKSDFLVVFFQHYTYSYFNLSLLVLDWLFNTLQPQMIVCRPQEWEKDYAFHFVAS
jgi:hypothetical protein